MDAQSRSSREFGRAALGDPLLIPLLATAVSTAALYLAAMILITQRHDDEMATRREQITLELAILSEQKSAKIIAPRRKNCAATTQTKAMTARSGGEAMAQPADAQVVLDAISGAGKGDIDSDQAERIF